MNLCKTGKLLTAILLFSQSALNAQQQEAKFTIAEGPYLQHMTDTGFTVVWTSSSDAVAWVELAPDDGSHFYQRERPKYYQSSLGRLDVGKLHHVRVEGLEPGTAYRYRIYQQAVSYDSGGYRASLGRTVASEVYGREPYRVTTSDPGKKEIGFLVVNDIHSRDSLFVLLTKSVMEKGCDFVIFNGDMTSYMTSEKEIFDGYLRSASGLFATETPFYMARGNHETRGSFAGRFMDYFPSPTGKPYYTFRQGPAFFVVLDGAEDKPDSAIEYFGLADYDAYRREQAEWLAGIVESPGFKEAGIRIVILHMPPGERDWHGPRMSAELFVPLLCGRGVDLMLSGHLHREVYMPAGEGERDFPVFVNSNNTGVRIDVKDGVIALQVLGPDGAVKRELEFR